MYYPYLRGKQFELILLRENAELLAQNSFHPIIEPVKENLKSLLRTIEILIQNGVSCTIIINPLAGKKPIETSLILNELTTNEVLGNDFVSLGYILNPNSKLSDLTALLRHWSDLNFSLIHYGFTNSDQIAPAISEFENIERHIFIDGYAGKLYQRHLKKNGIERILIRDGFKSQIKNSLYPQSEHFSDLHITFPDEGMDGFGDFLIVGDDYIETGGPAWAIAIHLTYLKSDSDMFIYHFVSDQTNSPTNPGGKFLEALEKLVKTINNPKSGVYISKACIEYNHLLYQKHYPGLGYVKKLSMQHHLELIAEYFKRKN